MKTATKPRNSIQVLERECKQQEQMITQARAFAESTGGLTKEFEARLQVAQLDLETKKLLVEFRKTIGGG